MDNGEQALKIVLEYDSICQLISISHQTRLNLRQVCKSINALVNHLQLRISNEGYEMDWVETLSRVGPNSSSVKCSYNFDSYPL
jgi:hypothetical protein